MIRRDQAYWQRLRKDLPSNVAAGLAAIAVLAATLSVVGTGVSGSHFRARGNPLYWILMLPMMWWVSGLTTFAPRYVRSLKLALGLACAASVVSAIVSMPDGATFTVQTAACVVTIVAAGASLLVYRRSLVRREGPAR